MKISVEELKRMYDIIIDKAINSGFIEIEIDTDYYWTVLPNEREGFNSGAPEPGVGSIIDDIENLRKVLKGENPPTCVDFDRLANILIAIGERISRSDKLYI